MSNEGLDKYGHTYVKADFKFLFAYTLKPLSCMTQNSLTCWISVNVILNYIFYFSQKNKAGDNMNEISIFIFCEK